LLICYRKSQIAIEYCYRYRVNQPEGHVFWVHSVSFARFDQAYREIARKLKIRSFEDPEVDILRLVVESLSGNANYPWLMVLDNADDQEIFFDSSSRTLRSRALINYLPRSSKGSVLITTRDKRVGDRLVDREKSIIVLPFEADDAKHLLRTKLSNNIDWNEEESMELLETLHYLPLAITQAAASVPCTLSEFTTRRLRYERFVGTGLLRP